MPADQPVTGHNVNQLPPLQTGFDSHHPPSSEILNKCVHCGFCLATCPTYLLWGQEMDSPRGRIHLIRLASEGSTPITPKWVQHFDTCLGCMACMTSCPSGVDYGKLIEATRAQIARLHERSLSERLHRKFLFEVFTRADRLHLLRWPLWMYQKSGLQNVIRKMGALNLFPRLRAMDTLMPKVEKLQSVPELVPAKGVRRHRVGMLLGCVQREFLSRVNVATANVLAAEGCEVVAPPQQPCCGALLMHAGEETAAADLARRMIDLFEARNVDVVIVNAGGCGSSMKEYGHLLRDDTKYAERAQQFSARCRDVSEFLAGIEPRAIYQPLALRVAYHDSCHLQHAQLVRNHPRSLLARIPGLELVEMPEGPICCGSAGIYNLVQPTAADALGDRKAQIIGQLPVDAVATGNPGCILQMGAALARSGNSTTVAHTIEFVAASISGEESLLAINRESQAS